MIGAIVLECVPLARADRLTLLVARLGILTRGAAATSPNQPGCPRVYADVIRFLLGAGLLATLLLGVTRSGTVCGGALFSADREA